MDGTDPNGAQWSAHKKHGAPGMKSILSGLILTALLSGCASAPSGINCPRLSPPPASVVDALDGIARTDPNAGAWVIALERHYQKLDTC